MKVTNWTRKLSAAIVAAGIWISSPAYAANIPLGDPSFEDYVVPAVDGFASLGLRCPGAIRYAPSARQRRRMKQISTAAQLVSPQKRYGMRTGRKPFLNPSPPPKR